MPTDSLYFSFIGSFGLIEEKYFQLHSNESINFSIKSLLYKCTNIYSNKPNVKPILSDINIYIHELCIESQYCALGFVNIFFY
jgi:hypothetical protein